MDTKSLLAFTLLACSLPNSPGSIAQSMKSRLEITPFITPLSYSWKEFDDNGMEALHESGLIVSGGASARYRFMEDLRWFGAVSGEYYSGTVDYNGFVFDEQGNRTPYSTKTGYTGFELTASSGYEVAFAGGFSLSPSVGLALEKWKRSLDNGGPSGYDELYTVSLAQIALDASYRIQPRIEIFSNLSLKFPLSITESVDLSRTGAGPSDLTFTPGSNPRYFVSAGTWIYGASAEFFYEGWTLDKSPEDRGYLQPQSSRAHLGVRVGYTFTVL
ncbi:MAG TPA: hypothetical protein VL126_02565 [Bacteroidota bacterium]|nr:hypothetical protein [Bacteroidota bacterium]